MNVLAFDRSVQRKVFANVSAGADMKANASEVAAHFSKVRLLHSGRHAARTMTPERLTICMSPSLSGAMLTVISRPS